VRWSFRWSLARCGLVAATCLVLLGSTASAAQSEPVKPPGCPHGFTAQTVEDAIVRLAGVVSEEDVRAAYAEIDVNGNGVTCVKPFSSHDKRAPFLHVRDDQAKP